MHPLAILYTVWLVAFLAYCAGKYNATSTTPAPEVVPTRDIRMVGKQYEDALNDPYHSLRKEMPLLAIYQRWLTAHEELGELTEKEAFIFIQECIRLAPTPLAYENAKQTDRLAKDNFHVLFSRSTGKPNPYAITIEGDKQ